MKVLRILTLTLLVSCISQNVFAEKDKSWERSLALGLSLTDGNSDTELLTSALNTKYELGTEIWRFNLGYNFGENNNETSVDNSNGLLEYKHLYSERFYAGMGLSYLSNEMSDVKYRAAANPAIGYFLLKKNDVKLNLEVGPTYIYEEVGGVRDDYLAPRIADVFDYKISETAKIFQKTEFIVAISDSENYLINSGLGVEAKMTTTLSLISALTSLYDNQPASGREKHDLLMVTSLAYSF